MNARSAPLLAAALFKVESIHHIHGKQCLCGFESAVSRDRTKHIMEVTLAAAVTQGLADDTTLADDWFQAKLREAAAGALRDAADAAVGMHDPSAPDCQEWADWLRARAATIEADQ
jgi:hypothetical protein